MKSKFSFKVMTLRPLSKPVNFKKIVEINVIILLTSLCYYFANYGGVQSYRANELSTLEKIIFAFYGIFRIPLLHNYPSLDLHQQLICLIVIIFTLNLIPFLLPQLACPLKFKQRRELAEDLKLSFPLTEKDKDGKNIKIERLPFAFFEKNSLFIENNNPNFEVNDSISLAPFEYVLRHRYKIFKAENAIVNGENYIKLYFLVNPEKYDLEKNLPLGLKETEIFIGLDLVTKERLIVNLQEDSLLAIAGSPNSGKTTLLNCIVYQICNRRKLQTTVVICTTKKLDWLYVKYVKRFHNKVLVLDMTQKESFVEMNTYLEKMAELKTEVEAFAEQKGIIDPSEQKVSILVEKYGFQSSNIYAFLIDESASYLKINTVDKEDPEFLKIKKKFLELISNHITTNARYLSAPLILSNAMAKADSIDIDIQNGLRIVSKTTSSQSKVLTGDERFLTYPFLKTGVFGLVNPDGGYRYVHIPFYRPKRDIS